jgi:hypothetical protein
MIHLFSHRPARSSHAWLSPVGCSKAVGRFTLSIFSGIGQFFELPGRGIYKILKDFVHRPVGFSFTCAKILAGAWICHKCVSSPQFLELNLAAKTGMFAAEWFGYLMIDGTLHWCKRSLHLEHLLHVEKKPLTRIALSLLANSTLMYAFQMPAKNYVAMGFQGLYTYMQANDLTGVFMKIVDQIKSTNDSLSPVAFLLQHPLEFFSLACNFLKDAVINPKRAIKNFAKGLRSVFEKFGVACRSRNWKEILSRITAILVPAALTTAFLLSMALSAGLSIAIILISITLGLLCAYILTQTCNAHWPTDD